jgi:hypothetical protein
MECPSLDTPKINNKHRFSCSVVFCGKGFKSEHNVVCMLYRKGLKEHLFLAVDTSTIVK